jgi:hypothetical protein
VTLKRKPIAVRASHGINFFHTKSFIGVLSIHQGEIHLRGGLVDVLRSSYVGLHEAVAL